MKLYASVLVATFLLTSSAFAVPLLQIDFQSNGGTTQPGFSAMTGTPTEDNDSETFGPYAVSWDIVGTGVNEDTSTATSRPMAASASPLSSVRRGPNDPLLESDRCILRSGCYCEAGVRFERYSMGESPVQFLKNWLK